jgi:hypothetical protein
MIEKNKLTFIVMARFVFEILLLFIKFFWNLFFGIFPNNARILKTLIYRQHYKTTLVILIFITFIMFVLR